MRLHKFFAFFILVVLLAFSFLAISDIFSKRIVLNKIAFIKKGESTTDIAQKLEEEGIIKSAATFLLLEKIIPGTNPKYGKYRFNGRYNYPEVLKKINGSDVVSSMVTIPEGYTNRKIAALFARKDLADFYTFDSLTTDSTFISSLGLPVGNLEGFLFPDTYEIPYYADEKFIIRKMVDNFRLNISHLNKDKIKFDSLYSTLILASIVEREAAWDKERDLIAGVYTNRLQRNMLLQADPTVAYALELNNQSRKKIYYKDLKIQSKYNTYIYRGLPPTPICNPGLQSILAAFEPRKTNYLFFFAGDDSRHIFSKTYWEHLKKLNRI
ncbi:MAG: endolytic transglycosylase MltG [Candidatus Cloacimonetes bacterium]|nr:endolytic transglycosylase MltG [Candidatus Cloacimonadota bacterium]